LPLSSYLRRSESLSYAIGIQNIVKHDDSQELMKIGAAHNREDIESARSHALQREGQTVIDMDVC
jgi:hypothetical protein